jgi:hypothetical protein
MKSRGTWGEREKGETERGRKKNEIVGSFSRAAKDGKDIA